MSEIPISGLTYIANFLTSEEQKSILSLVDAQPWEASLKRRVQQYGYAYDYKSHSVKPLSFLGALPNWAKSILDQLVRDKVVSGEFDQLIVNEYLPGQGISSHVDSLPCFGDTIVSISLGSSYLMFFSHIHTKEKREILLEQGSVLTIKDDARSLWKHGIAPRKSDYWNGKVIKRSRRISLTFRKVLLT